MGLGTTNGNTSLFRLDYSYGAAASNNGNLLSQAITVGSATPMAQTYGYDNVNRLLTATEGSHWSQSYEYDRFGNRTILMGLGTTNGNTSLFRLDYAYGAAASNNGNLLSQAIAVGTAGLTQNYGDDALNRLLTATEGSHWSQSYESS
jgi:hypothetical protein